METKAAGLINWDKIVPFFIVLLCAILEPRLITIIMVKANVPASDLFGFLTYLMIGCWIIAIWFLLALIPFLFSQLYDAEGKFKVLLYRTGYGFLPMLIGLAISFFLADKLSLPENSDLNIIQKDTTIRLIANISMISMSLSLPWVVYCLHQGNKISWLRSFICVGVPFGIMYLLSNLIATLI